MWSNTAPDGTSSGGNACDSWTSPFDAAIAGNLNYTDSSWTESDCTNVACQATMPIYCFQQ